MTYSVRRFAGGSAPEITGAFSYIKNNAPYDQPIISLGLTAAGDALADRPNTTAVDTSDEVSELSDGAGAGMETDQNSGDTDNTSPVQTDRGSTSTADVEQELPENSVTSFPDPELGITYKVQIAAAHRTVGKSYFIGRHGFMEQFNIENDEGWVKYTTGKHQVYKNARDARDRIRTNYPTFKGPFVTAYSDGDRITVQEALMISNQQWYK